MKIKCRYCKKEKNYNDWEELCDHWESAHGYEYNVDMGDYAELIFKIHEKIEFYEFMVNRDDDISYSPNHIRKILKSLLK